MKNPSLHLCNLASKYGLKTAREMLAKSDGGETKGETETPKPSLAEQKDKIAGEIVELGGEAPEPSASMPAFKQALKAAKKKADKSDDANDLM